MWCGQKVIFSQTHAITHTYMYTKMKWYESVFRPPLCTYRLNWAMRTSWGWWDDWDDTVLQTQESKFEPWRSEAEHATSRSWSVPTILTFTRGWGRNIFVSFKLNYKQNLELFVSIGDESQHESVTDFPICSVQCWNNLKREWCNIKTIKKKIKNK